MPAAARRGRRRRSGAPCGGVRFQLVLGEEDARAAPEVHAIARAGQARLPGYYRAGLAGMVAGGVETTCWPPAKR